MTAISFGSFPQLLLPFANDCGGRKNQVPLGFSKGEHWKEARSHARVCRSLASISAVNAHSLGSLVVAADLRPRC